MREVEAQLLPVTHMSSQVIDSLRIALRPEVLGKNNDRFDMGVEFQKFTIREQLNTILNKPVF